MTLELDLAKKKRNERRQTTVPYLGADGNATTECGNAALYSLEENQLSANGQLYSTNPGVQYQMFVPSDGIETITTNFYFTDSLNWVNDAFTQDPALFCLMNGFVYVVFDDGALPDCQTVVLTLVSGNNGKHSKFCHCGL